MNRDESDGHEALDDTEKGGMKETGRMVEKDPHS